ncbi:MAG: FtsW/RodA/SpoVE family cell cycle protein, partial [Pseudomonadota bacterium]
MTDLSARPGRLAGRGATSGMWRPRRLGPTALVEAAIALVGPDTRRAVSDWWHGIDRWLLGAVVLLVATGLVLGLAASVPLAEKNGLWAYHYVARQAVFAVLGIAIVVGVSALPLRWIRRGGILACLAAIAALAALPSLGTDFGKGAVRWYSFGMSIQPSEFMKPGFAILMGWMMAAASRPNGPPGVTMSFALMLAVVGSLAIQPDFGQSLLIVASWGAMFFVWGASIWLMVILVGLGVGLIWFAYSNFEYIASRIDSYWAAEIDPTSQIGYATNAILQGGLFGVGAGEGSVKWSLPDAHTDFVMAVAAEE